MSQTQHMLIIGTVWPEPTSSAAGSRMLQLIELFLEQNWHITFASAAVLSDYSADLKSMGVDCKPVQVNSSDFDRFIEKLNPDMVMFDRFMTEEQFGWRVAEKCPDALRILDTEDLHCLRLARQKAWKKGRDFQHEDLLTEEIAKREIASIYRCDLSLIISEFEYELLISLFGIDQSLLCYLPFLIDPVDEDKIKTWPGFDERSDFISIGNFLHEPNWNAVLWLKEEIWPEIRKKMPKAVLKIYGAYPSQKVFQLHNEDDGFLVMGRAENSVEVLGKARVLLAPIRFGAGIKGKLVEAMLAGTPSVTTDIGTEGIHGDMDWAGLVENNPVEFASAAVMLYQEDIRWTDSQRQGAIIINSRFRGEVFGKEFVKTLKLLKNGLDDHRKKNFTGSMLMHHSTLSTRYMSKWIEAKNRNEKR